MAQDKDKLFEKIYFMWKGEGDKRNHSIDFYCERYGANVGKCPNLGSQRILRSR